MLPQQPLSCSLVVTLVAGIFDLQVDSSFVNSYAALLCPLVRALITGPPLLLMEGLKVFCHVTFLRSFEITQMTGKIDSYVL